MKGCRWRAGPSWGRVCKWRPPAVDLVLARAAPLASDSPGQVSAAAQAPVHKSATRVAAAAPLGSMALVCAAAGAPGLCEAVAAALTSGFISHGGHFLPRPEATQPHTLLDKRPV